MPSRPGALTSTFWSTSVANGGRVAFHGRLGEADVLSPRGRDLSGRLPGSPAPSAGYTREQGDQSGRGEPHVVPHGSTSLSPECARFPHPGVSRAAKSAQGALYAAARNFAGSRPSGGRNVSRMCRS